jgi:hypothetical protein
MFVQAVHLEPGEPLRFRAQPLSGDIEMVIDELVVDLNAEPLPSYTETKARMRKAVSLLLAMKESLERARPHVVNASLGVVPKESEACAMADLRMIDATLNQGVPGDVR